jgi:hypothetical protein
MTGAYLPSKHRGNSMRPSSIIAVCLMLLVLAACTPEPAKPGTASQLPSVAPEPAAKQPSTPAMSQAPPVVVEPKAAEPEPINFNDTLSQSIDDFQYDIKVT